MGKLLDLEDVIPGEKEAAANDNQKAEEWQATLIAFRRYRPPATGP